MTWAIGAIGTAFDDIISRCLRKQACLWLTLSLVLASACTPPSQTPAVVPLPAESEADAASARPLPNIVFIMADDLGWGDLSSYGRSDYGTPNIDQLAAEGVRLTQAYSIAPLCTPTRVGFMTGRYPERHPIGRMGPLALLPEHRKTGLAPDPDRPTVPALLAEAGYATALIGKWHLGEPEGRRPNDHGFGYFFGNLAGHSDYTSHLNRLGEPNLFRNEEAVAVPGYLTDLYSDEAVAFVRRAERPFFLSLQYTAPHWPYQKRGDPPLPADANAFRGGSMETYAAMVQAMDEGVGRVVDALEAAGLSGSTLLVFASDNGGELYPPWGVEFSDMGGLRGDKAQLWEGGIRVPAIVRWPARLDGGIVSDQVITTLDLTATLLAAAGASPSPDAPLDGIDLLPFLRGEAPERERTVFWRTPKQEAVRSGRWKYIATGEARDEEVTWQESLFDLLEDPGEQQDLAEKHPETVALLREKLSEWKAQMRAPDATTVGVAPRKGIP